MATVHELVAYLQGLWRHRLRGLAELCLGKKIARAYLVTKALNDFGEMEKLAGPDTRIMKVPARLLCYWIGQAELLQSARPREE